MSIRVIGMDLSLRHGAFVELGDDFSCNYWYYTDRAGAAKRSGTGFRIPPAILKVEDFHKRNIMRLVWLRAWVRKLLIERQPYAVALEDYAYDAGQGSHQLGELGGTAHLVCWDRNIRLRMHSPGSVKMFGGDNGNATKEMLSERVKAKWNVDWTYCDPPAKPSKKKNTNTSEDLVDAYVLARMALVEVKLRKGMMNMQDLGTDKERQCFLRTTPTFPVNVLGREWVVGGEEEGGV